jgi:hypothetical protein
MEKAVTQKPLTRGRVVPETDTGGFKAESNFQPVSVIGPSRDQRQLSHHCSHFRLNSYWELSARSGRTQYFLYSSVSIDSIYFTLGAGNIAIYMKVNSILKFMFILGAVVDGAIAVSWFLIASGWKIPNILNGYIGSGPDYQLAMYGGAMFMAGWTVLLAWGSLRPIERRDLLLITSGFLLLSVIIEFVFFSNFLGGTVFVFGVSKRLILSVLFSSAFFYSLKSKGS